MSASLSGMHWFRGLAHKSDPVKVADFNFIL